jgi:hypothetical protein
MDWEIQQKMKVSIDELRSIPFFEGMAEEEMEWLWVAVET